MFSLLSMPSAVSVFTVFIFHVGGFPQIAVNLHYTFLFKSKAPYWRRQWQPTPVFLPEESQGWGSLVGYRLQGRTESDMTEAT